MLRRSSQIRVARPVTLLISLALVVLSLVTATAGASKASTTGPLECLGASDRVRLGAGSQGADPNSLSPQAAAAAEQKTAQRMQSRRVTSESASKASTVTIDVRWHVITRRNGTGAGIAWSAPPAARGAQRRVRRPGRRGRKRPTVFQFQTKSVDYTANTDWYNWSDPDVDPSDNREAKKALHQGGFDDLNVYIAGLEDGLLGYAHLPLRHQPDQRRRGAAQ